MNEINIEEDRRQKKMKSEGDVATTIRAGIIVFFMNDVIAAPPTIVCSFYEYFILTNRFGDEFRSFFFLVTVFAITFFAVRFSCWFVFCCLIQRRRKKKNMQCVPLLNIV